MSFWFLASDAQDYNSGFHTISKAWFGNRVLLIDRPIASRWASLVAESSRAGRPLPTIDSFIAATALTHDLTIVTRNVRDFEGTGIVTLNPWRS